MSSDFAQNPSERRHLIWLPLLLVEVLTRSSNDMRKPSLVTQFNIPLIIQILPLKFYPAIVFKLPPMSFLYNAERHIFIETQIRKELFAVAAFTRETTALEKLANFRHVWFFVYTKWSECYVIRMVYARNTLVPAVHDNISHDSVPAHILKF